MLIRHLSVIATICTLTVGSTSSALAAATPKSDTDLTPTSNQLLVQRRPEQSKQKFEEERGRFIQELNLTEQQQRQIREIRQKYQGQISQQQQELKSARQQLGNMMVGTESNSAIRAKHRQVTTLQQKLGELRFETMLEMREVLTPEQRRKFAQMIEQRWQRARNRFSRNSF
ncbi:MAG: Spy/CpxP family protein refolding chaperone [Prochloraceae cyanobacterium]